MYANEIAGANAIGRIDIVENRFVGIKSRGVYETPGGTLLRDAHMDLEGICMDREVKRITEGLANEFARLCYNGFWFAPEMDLIRNSVTFSQKDVTGVVSMELYKGNVICRGRTSPFPCTVLTWPVWILRVVERHLIIIHRMLRDSLGSML